MIIASALLRKQCKIEGNYIVDWQTTEDDGANSRKSVLKTIIGFLDARIVELDQKIAHNPNDPAAFAALGMAYLEKGDYTRALEKINMSIVLEPRNATR